MSDIIQVRKAGFITASENVWLDVRDAKTKELIRTVKACNHVTNQGLNLVRDFIANTNRAPSHIAVGTDNTAPADGDTALGAEVFRDFITRRITSSNFKLKMQLFIDEDSANGNTLVEAGIFQRITAGEILSHVTYSPIVKTIAITVNLTWEFTIGRA